MQPERERVAGYWLAGGEQDLRLARAHAADESNVACFHAQQSAGKSLKALLVAVAGDVARTHVATELISELAEANVACPEAVRVAAVTLDRYYAQTRYPDALGDAIPRRASLKRTRGRLRSSPSEFSPGCAAGCARTTIRPRSVRGSDLASAADGNLHAAGRLETRATITAEVHKVAAHANAGWVESLWRYPVKSMLGETAAEVEVSAAGVFGDRVYALIDRSDGKVASAKNPRKWPHLFAFHAALSDARAHESAPPPVRITSPDGDECRSDRSGLDAMLSQVLKRAVVFRSVASRAPEAAAAAEAYWPDIEGLELRDTLTAFSLPRNTFFDAAPVHVLTTATLERLSVSYPAGRFDVARFRPNIVIGGIDGGGGFVENDWVGRTLSVGSSLRLRVTRPCARCVMTTLAQGDLPNDPGILRTAARENAANVGAYASVLQPGTIRRGDRVTLG